MANLKRNLQLLTLMSLGAAPATAQAFDPGFTLGLAGGYWWFEPAENFESTFTVLPRAGYWFKPALGVELDFGFLAGVTQLKPADVIVTTTGGAITTQTQEFNNPYRAITPRLNLLVDFLPEKRVHPFGAVGVGLIRRNVLRDEVEDQANEAGFGNYKNPEGDFLINVGPGLMVELTERLGIRLDVRYLLSAGGEPYGERAADVYNNIETSLGLGFRFGGDSGPKDADGDGIADDVDACPQDPEDMDDWQDEDGCPDADNDEDGLLDAADQCPNKPEDFDEFEDDNGCPDPDNDKDGVVDVNDKCPLDPEDIDQFEDEDGCPDPDNDKDGIADNVDKCPVVAGVPEAEGCPPRVVVDSGGKEIYILQQVFFELDSDVIKPESFSLLDEVAKVLTDHPELTKIEVQGHTDQQGTDSYNMDLSKRRANSVRTYLIGKGIDGNRLVAKGYGESKLLDKAETEDAYAKNRRVQFIILKETPPKPTKK